MPRSVTSQPARLQQRAQREAVASCRSRPARSGSPGIISSSPVENSATRGRRTTGSVAGADRRRQPQRLRRQPRAAAQHGGAGAHVLAAAADPLARRAARRRRARCRRRRRPPRTAPASRPRRRRRAPGAPVKMRAARAAAAAAAPTLPAGMRCDTGSTRAGGRHVGGAQRVAVHRRVVLRAARRAPTRTSAASTRPSASKVDTVSVAAMRRGAAPATRRASASSSVSSGSRVGLHATWRRRCRP